MSNSLSYKFTRIDVTRIADDIGVTAARVVARAVGPANGAGTGGKRTHPMEPRALRLELLISLWTGP